MNLVAIGKVFSVFGLNGKVKFYPYIEDRDMKNFLNHDVWIGRNSKKVSKIRINSLAKMSNHQIIGFDGFDSVDKVKNLAGQMIYVDESDLPVLRENEYYFYQLIESTVYYEDGSEAGIVTDVIRTGSNDVLVIGNEEILVPVIKDYILEMDLKNHRITVRKMEWF
ncbi:ribosome maturation factor RimM [Athalassotoga saccharophila]|uniref:ribosome maturation factor RimM n=1 Tax=Athalassotoga saccharophila TaxID=1441386 RepID=UPI00137A1B72|nr:ribosome maturation factor RimM [Athalassotoga saccharophila]BBJ27890.1 ribosome maturation factor RimM [Athalassotoga saccharophila]